MGVIVAVALPLLAPTLMGTAQACSCAPRGPVEDDIATHDWVFVGRQIGRDEVSDGLWRVVLEIEVVDVYKGDVPAFVELRTGFGQADCGIDFSDGREVGFTVSPTESGPVVSSCGGAHRADTIRFQFEPLPVGTGTGPPGFLVGTTIGPARIAVVDESGELLRYADGDGRLAAATVCPGGRKIVEVLEPVGDPVTGPRRARLEVRDVATLEIERSEVIDVEITDLRPLNGFRWIFDLACHAADGRSASFLFPTGVWDSRSGAELPGPATLMLWDGNELAAIDAGSARTAAVDVDAGRFYAVTGIDGRTLETRDLGGELLESVALPGSHVAWKMVLSDDGSALVMLARNRPMGRDNWFFAEVDRLLVVDLVDGSSVSEPLPARGFASYLAASGGGYVIGVSDFEADVAELSRFDGEEVVLLTRVANTDIFRPMAIGSRVALVGLNEGSTYDSVDLGTGEILPIEGLVRARIAVALPPGLDIEPVEIPEAPTTITASTDAPPSSVPATSEPDDGDTTTTTVVSAAGGNDDSTASRVVFTLLALAVVAAGGVLLLRSRNSRS